MKRITKAALEEMTQTYDDSFDSFNQSLRYLGCP
jgi:hypothetical protein